MLINAQNLIYNLCDFRTLYISGIYGTGKTLSSVAISYELWRQRRVQEISANFPLYGVSRSENQTDFVMILDEASRVLSDRTFSKNDVTVWLNRSSKT